MKNNQENTSLRTMGSGAAIERFDDELLKVLENILDPNTEATEARKITLEVTLKPNSERTTTAVNIVVKSKISPASAYPTVLFIGQDEAGPRAFEYNSQQLTFNDFSQNENANETVTQLRKNGETI